MKSKVYNIPKSSTPRSLKLISHMRKRGDEESFLPVMSDESIEYVGTFPPYYQKIVPGTSSATENDDVPKIDNVPESDSIPVNVGVPGCSSDLKENIKI
ncbi:hypothetical protein JTB14_020161 [Gonioctena quinquepunctata]|nr:hypothetical protein JTB14_020161 [Gonioctena quinquepunctata]